MYQARDGDKVAFGKLVEHFQSRIYAVAYGIIGNHQDAEDIAQDTFIKAYKNIGNLEREDAFYSWIVRIAVNTGINYKKTRNVNSLVSMEDIYEPLYRGETPDSYIEKRGETERIQELLAQLPPDSRAVLVLREIEGFGYEEIAGIIGIPVGTVRSRIHYAREKLRQLVTTKEVR